MDPKNWKSVVAATLLLSKWQDDPDRSPQLGGGL
jgi:hypothetical protein